MWRRKISLQIINNKDQKQYASVEPDGSYIELEKNEIAAIDLSAKRGDLVIIVEILDTGVAFWNDNNTDIVSIAKVDNTSF